MKKAVFTVLFTVAIGITSSIAQDGAQIFKTNCAVCHSIGKGKLVGPDLKGAHEKYEAAWLTKWIQSSQTLIKNGDAQAVEITERNPGMVMPDFALSDEEALAVINYISEKSGEKKEVAAEIPPTSVSNDGNTIQSAGSRGTGLNLFSGPVNIIVSSVMVLMLFIIIFLATALKKLSATINSKQ